MMSSSSEPHGMSVESVSPREYWDAVTGRWKKECWTRKKINRLTAFYSIWPRCLASFQRNCSQKGVGGRSHGILSLN